MLNETNASLVGTADHINWNLIAIIISIFTLVVAIIALYPSFAAHRREKKKDKRKEIEDRLNLFYIPLQDALNELDVNQIMNWTKMTKRLDKTEYNYKVAVIKINHSVSDFKEKYTNIMPYISLASDETTEKLELFMSIFDKNDFFKEKIVDFKKAHSFARYKSKILDSIMQKGCVEQYTKDSEHILDYYEKLQFAIDRDIVAIKSESV